MLQLTALRTGGRRFGAPPFFATKKLAIVGATAAIQDTPWHDPSWTIASHPCARPSCGREPDWYFDLHPPVCFQTQKKGWNPTYYTWLQRLQTPIFMQQAWPQIPMAVAYPLHRVTAEYRGFFSNHVAYLIALAMMEGVQKIGIFGCEYQKNSEYQHQRDSLIYWLGRAEQSGIELVLPTRDSGLLHPMTLYGYESHDAHGKLTGDYVPVKTLTKPGERVTRVLYDLGEVPHRAPPTGEAIAWDRAKQFFQIDPDQVVQ